MFEQAMLAPQPQGRKAWTMLVSFTCQCALVGLAILVPLLDPQSMPRTMLLSTLISPELPPAAAPPPAPEAIRATVRRVVTQFDGSRLLAPTTIPDKPAIIDETDLPPAGAFAGGVPGGVPGGIPGGVANGVIGSIITQTPMAAPPPPVQAVKPKEEPKPVQRIRQGGNVQEGLLLNRVIPLYPPLAKAARIHGVVRLQGIIGTDGRIQHLQVISGHPLLIQAALDAVRQWIYRPTMLNGDPVEVIAPIEVRFLLNQ
ncbi:MAG: energy transducer TonB [Bryobacteraceae bacterium]|nr:energy transducer TonB [Bryobacteraceae bacterium]